MASRPLWSTLYEGYCQNKGRLVARVLYLVGDHVHLPASAEVVSSILVKTIICVLFFRDGKRETT